ncbi:hypothetical protein [Shewanella sp.]|uniref:hypothetical protein n=1 Tax=Shewanella sp. TaxID=50422 RepID=UPI003D127DD5
MSPLKQEAMNTINDLPDDADMEEIMYRLYVLDKIRKGQEAAQQGRTISSDKLKQEIEQQW